MKGVVDVKLASGREAAEWAKRYRLFLWGLLLALLILAGCLLYGVSRRSEIPGEGTLVHSGEVYERKA